MFPHVLSAAVGIALMAAPTLLGYGRIAAAIDHIAGPVIASIGIMSASQILRGLRWVNVVIGGLLVVTTPLVDRPLESIFVALAAGTLLVVVGLVRGSITEDFGGGWSELLKR